MAKMNQVILKGRVDAVLEQNVFLLKVDDVLNPVTIRGDGTPLKDGDAVRIVGALRDRYVLADSIEKVE